MDSSDADALAQLTQVVPPPHGLVRVDWIDVENRLGFPLPADYRALVETYGEGSFDDFLWLLHPTSPNPNLNLISQLRTVRDALAGDLGGAGPRPEDLVPWAETDNGDVCYWRFDANRRLANRVVVNEAMGDAWAEFNNASATEWLLAVLTGKIRVRIFPDDFPSPQHSFRASYKKLDSP